jgi:hypothetical protein
MVLVILLTSQFSDVMLFLVRKMCLCAIINAGMFYFYFLICCHIFPFQINSIGTNFAKNQTSILEDTTLVAGWKPLGNAQLRYVKKCAVASIVANRLIRNPNNLSIIESVIVNNPELFHNITLKKPTDLINERRIELKGIH